MPRKLVPQRYVSGTFPAADQWLLQWGEAWNRLLADPGPRALLDRPGELLSEYFRERHRSRLGKIVTAANAWPDWCETVVLVAPQRDARAAKAMFAAAAHPFYNQLSAGGRGGRPRLLILPPTLDNDRLQGALDLLKSSGDSDVPHNRWALVVVEAQKPEVAATAAPFIAALGGDVTRHFVLDDDPTATLLATWDAPPFFEPAALLASSTVGADVVQQLKGAIWFIEQAKSAPAAENEAVQLAEFLSHGPVNIVVWHDALKELACDFARQVNHGDRVIAGYEPAERTRWLAESNSPRHLHLWSDAVRRDRIGEAHPILPDGEPYPETAIERFVSTPQPLVAAYDEVRAAENASGVDSAEIQLTRLGDPAVGELSAWLSAAIVLRESHG